MIHTTTTTTLAAALLLALATLATAQPTESEHYEREAERIAAEKDGVAGHVDRDMAALSESQGRTAYEVGEIDTLVGQAKTTIAPWAGFERTVLGAAGDVIGTAAPYLPFALPALPFASRKFRKVLSEGTKAVRAGFEFEPQRRPQDEYRPVQRGYNPAGNPRGNGSAHGSPGGSGSYSIPTGERTT